MIDTYWRPPKVSHIPLHPPRDSTPGEGIYLQLWQEFATLRPREWHAIFETNGPIRQRAASVAASFMVFMGCNGGYSFTYRCEQLAKSGAFTYPASAYLAAWALDNQRSRGTNHGLRTAEHILASKHPIESATIGNRVNWDLVPSVTQEDYDYLESMVVWWASPQARVMREIAEPMIEAAKAKHLSKLFEAEEA